MEKISNWLKKFKFNWENYNILEIIQLFNEEIIYFETPFQKITNLVELKKEWEGIKNQKNIKLNYKIFSKVDNKYTIIWHLKYHNKQNEKKEFAGTYLIILDKHNLCTYFHHSCESKE